MKMTPMNEPRGEGNGWDECTDAEASLFVIEDEGRQIEAFDTRDGADTYLLSA